MNDLLFTYTKTLIHQFIIIARTDLCSFDVQKYYFRIDSCLNSTITIIIHKKMVIDLKSKRQKKTLYEMTLLYNDVMMSLCWIKQVTPPQRFK